MANLVDIINRVRAYLRDYPENNVLLSNTQESSDADIADAVRRVIDIYNITPPYLPPVDINTFPNDSLLVMGTVIEILKSAQVKYARNKLTFNDAGISVSFDDQFNYYGMLIQEMEPDFMRAVDAFKTSQNLESCYGILARWNYTS